MTQPENIRLIAESMIRNFGTDAAQVAETTARRHIKPTTEGYELWQAVARQIQDMTAKPSRVSPAETLSPNQPTA